MANRAGKQKRKRYRELERKLASRQGGSRAAVRPPRLIGFTARRGMEMVCNADQCCVVCGNRDTTKMFLKQHGLSPQDFVIESASAKQVISGMSLGGKYALDREAFEKFLPSATAAGMNFESVKFAEDPPEGIWLVQVSF